MNRRFVWAWGLATAAIAGIAGGIGYAAGQANHLPVGAASGTVYHYGYWGFGFFPFFGLFWILLIGFLLFRFAFWRSWRGPYGYWHQHPGPGDSTPPTVPPQQTAV